jgi:glycosyltransferase involved in cell wall biosynthesis
MEGLSNMAIAGVIDGVDYQRRAGDRQTSDAVVHQRRAADRAALKVASHHDEIKAVPSNPIQVSVVMPCLNEEESVGICVTKALAGLAAAGKTGEVVVCDNGSKDNSVAVARAAGARVVEETARGYGNAYMTGFGASSGQIIVMGDSDNSYDFTELGALVNKVGEGYDYVLGSRFGGEIRQGAMTWSHRYIGNPILTAVLNRFFGLESSDAHSGMRAFTREALDGMDLKCEGMEFASEIVVKAARANLRVAEVPIIYHPRIGESKLNTLKDGWRHLRFLLLLSPIYLFVIPGIVMLALGLAGQGAVLALGSGSSNTNFSVFSALLAVTGIVTIIFGVFTQTFLQGLGFQKSHRLSSWIHLKFSLERNLVIAGAAIVAGLVVDVYAWADGIGQKWDVVTLMLIAIGLVVGFGSFFLSIFRVQIHGMSRTTAS